MAWKTRPMTKAVRTKQSGGFTLIEIVMVLAIAAVIMGGAVGLMVLSSDERVLRNVSGEVEALAKRARTAAILHQTSYALEFSEHSVRMLSWARAANADANPSTEPGAATGISATGQVNLDENMVMSLRRWNSDKWITLAKNGVEIWRFDPDGLCEPVSVRYTIGKSSAEDTFHPLTASIRESQLDAR